MHRVHYVIMLLISALILVSCSRTSSINPTTDTGPSPTSSPAQIPSEATPTTSPSTTSDGRPIIAIDAAGDTLPLDQRLFGTNVPAWVGAKLADKDVIAATTALGTSVLRLPGGSWSNSYSWLDCEMGNRDSDDCYWTWAARPTDFLNFIRATGRQAMWTVSINGTSKEAAALVAFFNGSVDDKTKIGVDVEGKDWKTIGYWASLRAEHGNPNPLPINLWEIGNEVYGGKPGQGGAECADWGWEDVWTCDGKEYMLGKDDSDGRREGYLEFREAMRAVDPTIQVGAVGVPYPSDWSGWGNEVIMEGGKNLDFYVVHYYSFDKQPESVEAILESPQKSWKDIVDSVNTTFDALGDGRRVPIAVTEYNLVAFQELDNDKMMTRAVNALFLADMIGQMAVNGVTMANQYDLINGKAGNGTDYGLLDADTFERSPQYYALALWTRFGDMLLPVSAPAIESTDLSFYAGRTDSGSLSLFVINKANKPLDAQIQFPGASKRTFTASTDVLAVDDLDSVSIAFNGVADPAMDLSDAPAIDLGSVKGSLDYTFAPYSLTLVHLTPQH
ncbi:MAG: alpha-L-arabinofuranosidase [Oscillochloris sp.]|nr:alpha-L-arabinofuranosidase [Oscillochloris sp.]